MEPIIGGRFHCMDCQDFDLCDDCYRFYAMESRIDDGHEVVVLTGLLETQTEMRPGTDSLPQPALATSRACDNESTLHDPLHKFIKSDGAERSIRLILSADPSDALRLKKYLETFPPSQASCEDLAWIQVLYAHPENVTSLGAQATRIDTISEDDRLDDVSRAWLLYTNQARKTLDATIYIANLAKQYGITSGKWMFFIESVYADAAWTCLATATSRDLCGHHVKVSSRDNRGRHAFCVYVKDYITAGHLDATRKKIEALRLPNVDQLLFKPDIYSWLDIHSGNIWGITPVLHKVAYPRQAPYAHQQ